MNLYIVPNNTSRIKIADLAQIANHQGRGKPLLKRAANSFPKGILGKTWLKNDTKNALNARQVRCLSVTTS